MDVVERRNGRLYLIGLAASLLGNSAMTLVAGIWVKSLTGSSAQAGLVSALAYAPTLAAPAAGLIADRVDRRRWLVVVNVVSAVTILSLLGVRSAGEVWLIDVAMTIYGVEAVLLDPAENALFAEIFGDEFRRRINGRRLAIQETGRLVAPLLAAGLFAVVSGGALDAGTFLVAAGVAARLVIGPVSPRAARSGSLVADLSAGIRYVLGAGELRRIAVAGAAVIAISAVGVAAQFSLVSAVGQPPAFLGVFSAVLGAGSIVAALTSGALLARIGDRDLALAGLSTSRSATCCARPAACRWR
jgi:MFS family permease